MNELLIKTALELALESRNHAYTPYSGFKVGAVIASSTTGNMYSGCNVENASYGATICAERNAVLSAIAAEGIREPGAKDHFDFLVVAADTENPTPPCAQCLQVLSEFCAADFPVLLANKKGILREFRFSELLPFPFDGSPLRIEE